MDVNSTQMEQRYVMMVLYFALGSKEGSAEWETWAQPGISECDWKNVGCNVEKRITDLQIEQARGRVPDEIGLLSSLSKYIAPY
jgi:hypothetical protein